MCISCNAIWTAATGVERIAHAMSKTFLNVVVRAAAADAEYYLPILTTEE
jgi:hypothetical protein